MDKVNASEKWSDPDHTFGPEPHGAKAVVENSPLSNHPPSDDPSKFSLNMVTSLSTVKRGFQRLPYDGSNMADEQFTTLSPSDGGFLGRPQGWER
jgi:hypothetical protein